MKIYLFDPEIHWSSFLNIDYYYIIISIYYIIWFLGQLTEVLFFIQSSPIFPGNPGLGMQLSLHDFDCQLSPPLDTFTTSQWDDLLAVSVLPGPMDAVCTKIAAFSDQWSTWITSARPERLPLPQFTSDQGHFVFLVLYKYYVFFIKNDLISINGLF